MSSLSRGKIETLVDGRDPSTGDGAYRLNFILPFLNTYDLNLTFGYTFDDLHLFLPTVCEFFSFLESIFKKKIFKFAKHLRRKEFWNISFFKQLNFSLF